MGIPDSPVLDLIEKIRSWSWGTSDLHPSSLSCIFDMADKSCKVCCKCQMNFVESSQRLCCQDCGRMFCGHCVQSSCSIGGVASDDLKSTSCGVDIKSCMFCSNFGLRHEDRRRYSDKIYPAESPRESPEPPSPSFSGEKFDGCSPHAVTRSSVSFTRHPSPVSGQYSPSRSDEDEYEDSANHYFGSSSEYFNDTSDIDSSSVSARHEFYSFTSVGSSPSDSPSMIPITSNRVGQFVHKDQRVTLRSHNGPYDQQTVAVLKRPQIGTEDRDSAYDCADDLSIFRDQYNQLQKPLDFENNGLIWFPPPPDDEDDEAENNFFSYDDEDDEIGESGGVFSSNGSTFPAKEKQNEDQKEPLRAVVQGHFRALVSQLLQGEGINIGKEDSTEDWVDIVTKIAWQAANFVRPDTSKGGSMDPGDYVKVKCVASGSPSESTFIKGVVCTKNIKHKRMTSQYKNPRLLILGGALEYQRVPNQLASFDTLLQQEMDHLKMIVSRIEYHRPNVLLVEKSVSSYAQEYLLAKEISLVLNVKRPLLERIARCTGALITPSVDQISKTRLGHCELFCLERVSEEHEPANQFNKKPSKTLMFFEGCPRRLGCTVLLKGSCQEELKRVKHVVQYAVFAAYHLSLETSFLADEGASLPKMTVQPSIATLEKTAANNSISAVPGSVVEVADVPNTTDGPWSQRMDHREWLSTSEFLSNDNNFSPGCQDRGVKNIVSASHYDNMASCAAFNDSGPTVFPSDIQNHTLDELLESTGAEKQTVDLSRIAKLEQIDEVEASSDYYSATDSHQSILVSFSSRCVLNGTVCERSRLLRIKFYGCFDKPLGKYLHDDLFDRTSHCHSCKGPAEAHVICYTHRQGNLTINVRHLPSIKLPGEKDGKIWMWHRCLKCAQIDGVPPATRRVVMSDAAWGLSFGKFLELSFSNHATANRVASCGHSMQRDCLRYYGFGSMVAFFQYSPIEIMSVCLPPSVLEFNGCNQQEWIRKEVAELMCKMEVMYGEILAVLNRIEQKNTCFGNDLPDASELNKEIMELKEQLMKEKSDYSDLLQPACEGNSECGQVAVDILELNRLRQSLIIGSHVWDHRLDSLYSLLKRRNSLYKDSQVAASCATLQNCGSDIFLTDGSIDQGNEESVPEYSKLKGFPMKDMQQEAPSMSSREPIVAADFVLTTFEHSTEEVLSYGEVAVSSTSLQCAPSTVSNLSDKIDTLWNGTDQPPQNALHSLLPNGSEAASLLPPNQMDSQPFTRLASPVRVYSFDSALRIQERIRKGLPPSSLHLTALRSFHASGDYRTMIRDPVHNVRRTCSEMSPRDAQKLNFFMNTSCSFISTLSLLPEGARLMVPQNGHNSIVIAVYDNEPTSIISYALSSMQYEDWVAGKPNGLEGGLNGSNLNKENSVVSNFSGWNSFGSIDLNYIGYGGYASEDASTTIGSLLTDPKNSPHLKISFEDDSSNAGGKVKFSVTCYFAKQFDALRKKCCPSEVDFLCSLSRCRRWSAQGGKSNVYFARSLDERFIIKQVTKTELESFEEFAPEYFKYLKDSLSSGSPTCLAKVLGIYQVTVKQVKGGKETKMDLMVMENLFFKRSISRVYDLKGSARSRYNSDTTGTSKVLLDMNLLETLRTQPIFLGSKAKRSLERAVWNDTNFLASVDVMDYSLLVGVDDERKELVLGIIDFMRQYTWDKHLETWVKASGILGGPKNASPTIISPKQYKKRFRKAMTTYFLTVPDQWSS